MAQNLPRLCTHSGCNSSGLCLWEMKWQCHILRNRYLFCLILMSLAGPVLPNQLPISISFDSMSIAEWEQEYNQQQQQTSHPFACNSISANQLHRAKKQQGTFSTGANSAGCDIVHLKWLVILSRCPLITRGISASCGNNFKLFNKPTFVHLNANNKLISWRFRPSDKNTQLKFCHGVVAPSVERPSKVPVWCNLVRGLESCRGIRWMEKT